MGGRRVRPGHLLESGALNRPNRQQVRWRGCHRASEPHCGLERPSVAKGEELLGGKKQKVPHKRVPWKTAPEGTWKYHLECCNPPATSTQPPSHIQSRRQGHKKSPAGSGPGAVSPSLLRLPGAHQRPQDAHEATRGLHLACKRREALFKPPPFPPRRNTWQYFPMT